MKNWQTVVIAIAVALGGIAVGWAGTWFLLTPCQEPSVAEQSSRSDRKPNILLFLADDTGYGDFQTYGHPSQEWTGVDRMMREGMRFTNFYSPSSLCSPSRAALLTGRYPIRSGIFGKYRVFGCLNSGGLPKREVTIAEALRDAGYATGMVGKWHLGTNEVNSTDGSHLPKNHGFDYVGTNLPFTQNWFCDPDKYTLSEMKNSCYLYNDDKIIEQPINLKTLSLRLIEDTKSFIKENKQKSFFFLLSFPQTHAALFSDPRFAGSSIRGQYGDNVNEMGWGVDEILDHLVALGIEKDTFAMFLSDNGPVWDGCGDGGDMGSLYGGKATTWEGGVRVPAAAWWPGVISPNSVSRTVVNLLDVFPTAMHIAGRDDYFSENNILIDGKSIKRILEGESFESPHNALFFYCSNILTAVRYGRYKIHYYTIAPPVDEIVYENRRLCFLQNIMEVLARMNGFICESNAKKQDPPMVFDVESDPAEHIRLNPTKAKTKRLVEIVNDLVQSHKATIIPVKSEIDKESGPHLQPCCNPPSCVCNYVTPTDYYTEMHKISE